MLGQANAVAMIAVKDIGKARKFYENTLGLKAESTEGDEVVTGPYNSVRSLTHGSPVNPETSRTRSGG